MAAPQAASRLSSNWAQSSEYGQSKVNAYVIRSSLKLFNNFTYFLDDPVNGDQFSQTDRRTVYGLNASHAFDMRFAGIETQTRVGLQTRGDDIHVGLFNTLQRATLSTVRDDSVQEGNVGLWADTTARWTDWLRTTVGMREDYFAGRVASDTPQNSGNAQAAMTSPKAGIVLGPWYKTEFYGNAGYGLHTNDIRGATITVDPNDKVTPLDRVPLLVRSKGAEIGVRTKAIEGSPARSRCSCSISIPNCCSSATPAPPSRAGRAAASASNGPTSTRLLPWMTLDLDVAYTRARFTDFDPAGDRIPGAPAWIASGGVTFGGETGWFGALRARYFGPRPLIEDDSVRSQQSLIFNARAGYRFDNGMRLQLDVLNLFNAQTNQIEYYYLSRLPGEPIGGVADRHVHPAEPLAVRLTLAARFSVMFYAAISGVFAHGLVRRSGTYSTARKCSDTVTRSTIVGFDGDLGHFCNRKRRLFVNLFRNKRRRSIVSGNTPNSPATSWSGFCLSAQCRAV